MNEKKKHKIMLGIEVILLCMIVAILGTNAASSNPPSNGVSYGKNNQTTVEGALNDLYTKANYGNAMASQILKDKTALVGGNKVTGTIPIYGSSVASSVVPWNESIYFRMPIGYYEEACCGTAEVYATNADVASAIGLTAGKLLKGQTVLGITGTGETSCPTCPECPTCPTCLNTSDATATAADISDGKTAYVNGQKITGTGMKGKTYEFTNEEATVSGQTFKYGTWTGLTTNEGTSYFSITLPFTPTELLSCHIVMTGNYTTSTNGRWGANFRSRTTADVHVYMNKLANGVYASNTNSTNDYTDTESDCVIDGNKLQLKFHTFKNGRAGSASMYQTVADKFYLTGAISYE
jgi:hypothetical protein